MLPNNTICVVFYAVINTPYDSLWHLRLAHPSKDIFESLSSVLLKLYFSTNNSLCEIFPLYKTYKFPFKSTHE